MKPIAAVVAIFVLVLIGLPMAGPLTGSAQAASGPLADSPAGPLTLRLTQVEPRVVTVDGPQTLTVNGVLTNTGDLPVDDMEIRVQRGVPLGTEGAVRDALDGNAGTDAVLPQFVPVPGELAPGAQLPVRLAVLLRGEPDSSLALSSTGVHELLVNVNGVPAGGARARLAAVRMLLPVLSLPPDPAAPDAPASSGPASSGPASSGAVPDPVGPGTAGSATTAQAASPFTLIYPIADMPRRLPTVPGEPALLTDDDLAASLAPDGRLGGLVAALRTAPVGSPVRDATCLAVDPDLVETVSAMRSGYQVLGGDGAPVPGTGAAVAGQWLDGLVAAARGGCVLALPFADADMVALNRGGLGELAGAALADGQQILAAQLSTPVLPLAWPADGVIDVSTLDRVAAAGDHTVLLSTDGIEQGRAPQRAGVLPIAGTTPAQTAILADAMLGRAAAGPRQPSVVNPRGSVPASTPAGRSTPLSTQDAIGALAFRARSGPDSSGAPVVLAPPHQWAADAAGATALLRAVDTMLEAGFLTPRDLGDVLADGPAAKTPARAVTYPLRAGGREVAGAVTDAVRSAGAAIDDLRSAAVADSGVGLPPDEVLAPLTRGLLRPMSAAWRGRPEAAIAAMTLCTRRISDLRASVRVLEPPSPYALGTSNAPILVTIGNGLPFTVQVRLEISSTSGLRVAPIEMQQVPPLGRRQARVSAEVTRSGQFTVLAAVRSPDGALLGPPSRLRVRSTAYGTITVWLTGSAGVLLVVLAIRRVLRRVRGEPSRRTSTSGPPQPGRPDLPSPHSVDPVPAAPAAAPVGSDVTEPVELPLPEAVPGDPEPIPAPDAGRPPTVPPTPAVVPALLAPSEPTVPPDRAFAPGSSTPPGRPVPSNRGSRADPASPEGPAGPPVPNSRPGPCRPAEPGRLPEPVSLSTQANPPVEDEPQPPRPDAERPPVTDPVPTGRLTTRTGTGRPGTGHPNGDPFPDPRLKTDRIPTTAPTTTRAPTAPTPSAATPTTTAGPPAPAGPAGLPAPQPRPGPPRQPAVGSNPPTTPVPTEGLEPTTPLQVTRPPRPPTTPPSRRPPPTSR